jgi:hypothetical protein
LLLLLLRLVFTVERMELELFVRDWCAHPEHRVPALAVVERCDVLEHGGPQLEPRRPAAAVDELFLESGEERLRRRLS